LKVKSEGYFTELRTLDYITGTETSLGDLKVGHQLDQLLGSKICEKYISPQTRSKLNQVQKKKSVKPTTPLFNKHVSKEQIKYYFDKIPKGALLSFGAKIHGTSARMSLTKVVRKPKTFLEKVKNFFGAFTKESWEYLVGTRNVVLFENEYNKEGFHGSEQYRFDAMGMVKPFLTKGLSVYGEIAGFANGKPIMGTHSMKTLKNKAYTKKYGEAVNYTYNCKDHEFRFHIYRISTTTDEGGEVDFTDAQCRKWCEERDLNYVFEVHDSMVYDGNKEKLVALVEELTERPDCLTEDYIDPSHISEGIVIRVDHGTLIPKFYKNKSYAFKVLEGIFKEDNEDVEDSA
jgi:hypothetical protein